MVLGYIGLGILLPSGVKSLSPCKDRKCPLEVTDDFYPYRGHKMTTSRNHTHQGQE